MDNVRIVRNETETQLKGVPVVLYKGHRFQRLFMQLLIHNTMPTFAQHNVVIGTKPWGKKWRYAYPVKAEHVQLEIAYSFQRARPRRVAYKIPLRSTRRVS
jgi:hypothetical protein